MTLTRADADALDSRDDLGRFRAAFDLPQGVIYLDGNSLGPPPRAALARLRRCAESDWAHGLVRSWNDAGWIDLPARAGAKIARLIGAPAGDVLVCDNVSTNIFKLAAALLSSAPGRTLAVSGDEFPTDQYILEGLSRTASAPLVRLHEGQAAPDSAVVIKSLVHYRTAAVADMAADEAAARARGQDIVWDLSHAAGAIVIDAQANGARFAVGCGYKYLNGGPGAPAYVYVRRADAEALRQPLSGWMGASAPFEFSPHYEPAAGVLRFASGTPPVLSLVALDAALDAFDGVDLRAVEAKAVALGDMFLNAGRSAGLAPVAVSGRRGAHVAFRHADGHAIVQALIARGVIGDFRAPDLLRFGFSPLYLTYADVFRAGEILSDVMTGGVWRDPIYGRRAKVT